MMKLTFLMLTFLIYTGQIANAQNIDSIVNTAATSFMSSGPRVGISIGVIKDDRVYQYNFGSTQKGKDFIPTEKTIYEIGSITKSYTSMLLAQALIDKKVNLNDDVRKYLKGSYPNLEYQNKPIRLLHLANLTSGLPDNLPEKMPPLKTKDKESQIYELKMIHDGYTKMQFLTDLSKVKLIVEPGLTPSHSNTAAQLLGFILENIYGNDYNSLLNKYIMQPLNMNGTFVNVPDSLEHLYAKGHNNNDYLMPEIPKDAGSAGILKSTLSDMIKYINHHLKEKDPRVVLSHTMTWGNLESFGIGLNWSLKTNFDGKRKIWSSGGTFGFSSYSVLYPERNFALIVLANENDGSAEDAAANIAQTVYNEIYFTPSQRSSEGFGFSKPINTLLDTLNRLGFEHAVEAVNDLKQKDTSFKLIEDELNVFGHHLLRKDLKIKALEIFKLNVSLFPQSANTYDSLAETYESMSNKKFAIKNYKRSLELNPSNTNAAARLKILEN